MIVFVAKPDTLETKLETMTVIQEGKDGVEAGVFVTYKVSPLLDIAMGMNIRHQFNVTRSLFNEFIIFYPNNQISILSHNFVLM